MHFRVSRARLDLLTTLPIIAAVVLTPVASAAPAQPVLPSTVPACPGPVSIGTARCFAHVRTDVQGKANAAGLPSGFSPVDLDSAYNLSTIAGAGAVVDLLSQ